MKTMFVFLFVVFVSHLAMSNTRLFPTSPKGVPCRLVLLARKHAHLSFQ